MKILSYIAVAGALAAASVSFDASALDGSFVAPSGIKATFTAESVHVTLVDGTMFTEPVETDGDTITIISAAEDPNCPGMSGVYAVAVSDAGATFTLVSDECEVRITELTAGLWAAAAE